MTNKTIDNKIFDFAAFEKIAKIVIDIIDTELGHLYINNTEYKPNFITEFADFSTIYSFDCYTFKQLTYLVFDYYKHIIK